MPLAVVLQRKPSTEPLGRAGSETQPVAALAIRFVDVPAASCQPRGAVDVGGIVWAFFTVATIAGLAMIPHLWWMWSAGILACLVFGALGLASSGPREYIIAVSRTIHAPVEKVFRALAHVEDFSKAVPGIQKIEFLSDCKTGVDTRLFIVAHWLLPHSPENWRCCCRECARRNFAFPALLREVRSAQQERTQNRSCCDR